VKCVWIVEQQVDAARHVLCFNYYRSMPRRFNLEVTVSDEQLDVIAQSIESARIGDTSPNQQLLALLRTARTAAQESLDRSVADLDETLVRMQELARERTSPEQHMS